MCGVAYSGAFCTTLLPTVTQVRGCPSFNGAVTTECPTEGAVTITVTGTNFGASLAVTVAGRPCAAATRLTVTTLTCVIPGLSLAWL